MSPARREELPRRPGSTRRGRETRQKVINGALAALDQDGFAALRIESIAVQAGIGVGTPYGYFPDKDSVVVAVAEMIAAELELAVSSKVGRTGMPVATFRGYIHYLAELITQHPGLLTVPAGTDAYKVFARGCTKPFVALLELGLEDGELRTNLNPELVALYHIGGLLALAHANRQWEASRLAEFVLDSVQVSVTSEA